MKKKEVYERPKIEEIDLEESFSFGMAVVSR
jgi:hypothetical protein